MAIRSDEFEKVDRASPMKLILEYLRVNSNNAFSEGELEDMLSGEGVGMKKDELKELLSVLSDSGRVDSRAMGGENFYRCPKVRGFMPIKRYRV